MKYDSKRVDALLDVGDSLAGVEVLRTRLRAVHDGVTPAIFVIGHITSQARGMIKGQARRRRERGHVERGDG